MGGANLALYGMPLAMAAFAYHGYGSGDTGMLAFGLVGLVITGFLAVQFRSATPIALEDGCLLVRVGLRDAEISPREVAWVFTGIRATSRRAPTSLVVGLRRRRFLGAKWIFIDGDIDGEAVRFFLEADSRRHSAD